MKTKLSILTGPLWLTLLDSRAWAMPAPFLAQVTGSLKNDVSLALGVMFLFGFLWGVVKIWSGCDRVGKGDPDGQMGIIAGAMIAGAAVIMGTLFSIFGMGDGSLTPSFGF